MEILFASNTLTNPAAAVKDTRFTRQDLLDAADGFFARYDLVRVAVSDQAAPYVTTYGVCMVDSKRGYGVQLETAPSACGTGIIFAAKAIINSGEAWNTEMVLKKKAPSSHRWSTSQTLIQFGFPRDCDATFVRSIRDTFYAITKMRKRVQLNQDAVQELGERLFGASVEQMSGADYTVHLLPAEKKPEIMINIRTIDETKAKAILAILNK